MPEEKNNKLDPIRTLTILAELWAHQNGLSVERITITKKGDK